MPPMRAGVLHEAAGARRVRDREVAERTTALRRSFQLPAKLTAAVINR